jgi:hypothetical protein
MAVCIRRTALVKTIGPTIAVAMPLPDDFGWAAPQAAVVRHC